MPRAFFSYHSTDRRVVEDLAHRIRKTGLDVWLDQDDIDRTKDWIPEIERGLRECDRYAVFWGPEGYGEFQEAEMSFIKNKFVNDEAPCVVVRLPGTGDKPPDDLLINANHVTVLYVGDEVAVDDIYESLTGEKRETARAVREPVGDEDVEEALVTLATELPREDIVCFVGPTTDPPSVECMVEIHEELLDAMKVGPKKVPPRMETMGNYFAVFSSETRLEHKYLSKLRKYSLSNSPTIENLVAFLSTTVQKKRTRRGGLAQPLLVVTTRHDLMLERALLRKGLSFQRIVHHRDAEKVFDLVFEVLKGSERDEALGEFLAKQLVDDRKKKQMRKELVVARTGEDGEPVFLPPRDNAKLNQFVEGASVEPLEAERGAKNQLEELLLSSKVPLVLYKFAGSIELAGSCLMTSEQHVEFARRALESHFIPRSITSRVQTGTPVLVMGYSLLDADLRLLRKTVLEEEKRKAPLTILLRPQPGSLPPRPVCCEAEQKLWKKLVANAAPEMHFKVLDFEEGSFLEHLNHRAAAALER